MEHATLHPPCSSLLACVHMAVERDTRGVQLTDAERFNFYPATPFPSISWILEGQLQMVEGGAGTTAPKLGKPLAKVVFAGPMRRPTTSWSPAAVHALTVSLYPEAAAELLGTSLHKHVDTIQPLERVLPAGRMGQLLAIEFDVGASPYERVRQALTCLWDNVPAPRASDVRSWLALLAARTSSTAGTAGRRQIQRLAKGWTGQSLRDLQRYARVESAMSLGRRMSTESGLSLAAVAAESGFADQSHLGREVRRVTGISPAKLSDFIRHDEAFWLYRLVRTPTSL